MGRLGSKKPCELFLLWLRGSLPVLAAAAAAGLSGEFLRAGVPSLTICAMDGRLKLCSEVVLELGLLVGLALFTAEARTRGGGGYALGRLGWLYDMLKPESLLSAEGERW